MINGSGYLQKRLQRNNNKIKWLSIISLNGATRHGLEYVWGILTQKRSGKEFLRQRLNSVEIFQMKCLKLFLIKTSWITFETFYPKLRSVFVII